MKIAISLPDDVFRRVERAAKRLQISRSELLARAASEFLEQKRREDVKESYDRAFASPLGAERAESDDHFDRVAAKRALRDIEW